MFRRERLDRLGDSENPWLAWALSHSCGYNCGGDTLNETREDTRENPGLSPNFNHVPNTHFGTLSDWLCPSRHYVRGNPRLSPSILARVLKNYKIYVINIYGYFT